MILRATPAYCRMVDRLRLSLSSTDRSRAQQLPMTYFLTCLDDNPRISTFLH